MIPSGAGDDEQIHCLSPRDEEELYARASGACVPRAVVTTSRYAHGYHQWVLMAGCYGLVQAYEAERGAAYAFVVRWRPDAIWRGHIVENLVRLNAWRDDKVLLGNHITHYCPSQSDPDCDLINDVFGVTTRNLAEAYFVDTMRIFRDEACLANYTELARATKYECTRDPQYPECKMATAVRRAGGDIPHVCSPAVFPYEKRLGCPFRGAGGPRGPPWSLRRWPCDLREVNASMTELRTMSEKQKKGTGRVRA